MAARFARTDYAPTVNRLVERWSCTSGRRRAGQLDTGEDSPAAQSSGPSSPRAAANVVTIDSDSDEAANVGHDGGSGGGGGGGGGADNPAAAARIEEPAAEGGHGGSDGGGGGGGAAPANVEEQAGGAEGDDWRVGPLRARPLHPQGLQRLDDARASAVTAVEQAANECGPRLHSLSFFSFSLFFQSRSQIVFAAHAFTC